MTNKRKKAKTPEAKKSMTIDRRSAVVGLGTIVLTALETEQQIVSRLVRRIVEADVWERVGVPRDREGILRRLFGMPSVVHLRPGDKHLYGSGTVLSSAGTIRGFPHDMRALLPFAKLFKDPILEDVETIDVSWRSADSVVCVGSPVSNELARQYQPYCDEGNPDATNPSLVRGAVLPYHFLYGSKKELQVRSWMEGGKFEDKRNHGLYVQEQTGGQRQLWRPRCNIGPDRRLARDFVLVTRLPRNLAGGEILIVAGGHGAGTQAIELLLDEAAFPTSELWKLRNAIGDWRYYQFVLEAFEMEHAPPATVATRLAVSTDCPPREVKFFQGLLTA